LEDGPPDVVIGHGRITGPAAQVQYKDHFPTAAGVHLIHMALGRDEVWLEAAPGLDALRELSGSVAASGVSQMVSVPHTDREVHDGSKGCR
jgi:hypothetical protein